MKIGIDIRAACGARTGKGQYTFHVVKELLALDRKNEYILYADKITADLAAFHHANIKIIHAKHGMWHFAVIKDFLREGGELFFAPTSFIIPAFLPKKIKSVITVHDLVAFIHPRMHQTKATALERFFLKRALRKASAVLVPSENTKRDLMRIFHYPEAKIAKTPLGVEGAGDRMQDAGIREKYNLPQEFILAVSGLEPRKNLNRLVDAFLALKNHPHLKLVIVGGRGWKSKPLQKKIRGLHGKILHIENCAAQDLPALYRMAKIFVFPSLYEGFGLPPLEALASGCPVICSNAASLPEVCGDATVYIDPNDTSSIAQALQKVLADEKLRNHLREKGLAQAKKFSWRKTAEKTLAVLKN